MSNSSQTSLMQQEFVMGNKTSQMIQKRKIQKYRIFLSHSGWEGTAQ